MVEVEIRTPIYNEESQQIEWAAVALVRAEAGSFDVYGDADVVPSDPVLSVVTGQSVDLADDPEEWVRNLPAAYRSGDLVAVSLRDDAPHVLEHGPSYREEPVIPEAASTTAQEAAAGLAG
jgi:hypothetical protein